ncbi:MAG: hypothetical protein DRJ47_06065 [Thermoprotei archaeon]|nr:MAG: hypothetical protein DRJ47_06065 [Thermoprotei archaeon]
MEEQIKEVLVELRDKVDVCIPKIVRVVKDIDDIMYDVEKEDRIYTCGVLGFEFSKDKQYKNNVFVDPDRAFVADVISFQFVLVVKLERHHPTDLVVRVENALMSVFDDSFRLLEFNDDLHMEEEKHHGKIIETMRKRLNGIDLDDLSSRIDKEINYWRRL